MSRRGSTLLTTLVISLLVFSLALVTAGLGTSHLKFSNHQTAAQKADYLAEAALLACLEKIRADLSFGQATHPDFDQVLTVRFQGQSGLGQVTFAPDKGLPQSSNCFDEPRASQGWGGLTVPRRAALIVARGEYRGVVREHMAVLHRPPFPYVLASSGPVRAHSGLMVGTVDSDQDLTRLEPDELLPGKVACNAQEQEAILLGDGSLITGDVISGGGVVLQGDAQVLGEVRAPADPVELPRISIGDYDPRSLDGSFQRLPSTLTQTRLQGRALAEGSLDVWGDLRLDQGLLFVEGDLRVSGGVRGTGVVAVTGNISVGEGARLAAGQSTALLAGGDVSLAGRGAHRSSFQGLVYTEGKLTAEQISLVGAFVSVDPLGGFQLSDTRLFYLPEMTRIEVSPRRKLNYVHLNSRLVRLSVERQQDDSYTFFDGSKWVAGLTMNQAIDAVVPLLEYYRPRLPRLEPKFRYTLGFLHDLRHQATPDGGSEKLEVDLSEMLSQEDRLRILIWRRI